jgi:8-oxo-dGTP diphosphatase
VPPGRVEQRRRGFDHRGILDVAPATLRERLAVDLRIAASLVPAEFTKAQLRGVFEIVSGQSYDKSNFNKRFNRMIEEGTIAAGPGVRTLPGPGRPAKLFSFCS